VRLPLRSSSAPLSMPNDMVMMHWCLGSGPSSKGVKKTRKQRSRKHLRDGSMATGEFNPFDKTQRHLRKCVTNPDGPVRVRATGGQLPARPPSPEPDSGASKKTAPSRKKTGPSAPSAPSLEDLDVQQGIMPLMLPPDMMFMMQSQPAGPTAPIDSSPATGPFHMEPRTYSYPPSSPHSSDQSSTTQDDSTGLEEATSLATSLLEFHKISRQSQVCERPPPTAQLTAANVAVSNIIYRAHQSASAQALAINQVANAVENSTGTWVLQRPLR